MNNNFENEQNKFLLTIEKNELNRSIMNYERTKWKKTKSAHLYSKKHILLLYCFNFA